ncbi:hypothetical protein [Microbispora sp. NPDC049633]|uniref:hypothetical protein n=1 Tax=Microbispora sp. NPDC049633 TaxID=3154355 RepID=UPI0034173ECD
MAYPQSRSCNSELREGMTDGAVRKPTPNRGGQATSPSNTYPGHVNAGLIEKGSCR